MQKIIVGFWVFLIAIEASAQFSPGQIGNNQYICYGYAPEILTFTTLPSGGGSPYGYRWQRSNDNGSTWSDITGINGARATYSPPVLGRNAWFRCRVSDALSNIRTTNVVSIMIGSDLTAGIIGQSQSITYGSTPAALTGTSPSGGSGSYSYNWQSSPDGLTWSDIPGANASGYTPQDAHYADRWYRRFVSDGLCGSTASNIIKISVRQITLYTTEVPSNYSNDTQYNLATDFRVMVDGIITAVRIYCHSEETGTHIIRLYRQRDDGNYEMLAGPFDWDFSPGIQGWREFKLGSAFPVEADRNYMVAVTNGSGNNWYAQSNTSFNPVASNSYIDYLNGYYGGVDEIPRNAYYGASYFRDIVYLPFSPGSIGSPQTICYNSIPSTLTQLTSPSGGTGTFTYQWQNSSDGTTWTNIQGATSQSYSPGPMTASAYFRRVVTSGVISVGSLPVLITVDNEFSLAEIQGPTTSPVNSPVTLNFVVNGGTPPYTIEYSCNGIPKETLVTSVAITPVSTGNLVTGIYEYELMSVTDALGCTPQVLGTGLLITASESGLGTRTNNALVIVNSSNAVSYPDFTRYVQPYLDWFGVPYEACDISSMPLPVLTDYGVIIFGHRNVYGSDYPLANLEGAVAAGTGLYSFDPHLFDFESSFNIPGYTPAVTSHEIDIITSPAHYITKLHINDSYHPTNNKIPLMIGVGDIPITISLSQSDFTLSEGINLATMTNGSETAPLLQVTSSGAGRIVKWTSYNWMFDEPLVLGPAFGMDDLIWRGIVWAARKPFVMQGLPPMITMRVDDVGGTSPYYLDDLRWLKISNEFGFIPWCGTFIDDVATNFYPTLKHYVDVDSATAIPHALTYERFIYENQQGLPDFDPVENIDYAWNVFADHSIPVSSFLVTHWYLLSSDAIPELSNKGVEFIGTHIPYDRWPDNYPGSWINCGPYRLERNGWGGRGGSPYFYAGELDWTIDGQNYNFFNCLTEIQDDGGYEWHPDFDVNIATARGIRHLRRAINSMALPTLFTHEDRIWMIESEWRQTLASITSGLAASYPEYDLEYKSMDDACKYIRAKENINISSVRTRTGYIDIRCSGDNDMATKCHLFTESAGQIKFVLVELPQISAASGTVVVTVSD